MIGLIYMIKEIDTWRGANVTENANVAAQDIETCRQIVVARAITWGNRRGRTDETYNALTAAGLVEYLPPRTDGQHRYVVPADAITRALTDSLLVISIAEDDDNQEAAETLQMKLTDHVAKWIRANVAPNGTNNGDRVVNVQETVRRYGPTDDGIWPTWCQEAHDELRRIVLAILTWGTEEDICDELERAIDTIGMGSFLPPRRVQVTLPLIPGGEPVTLTVNTDRLGQVDQDAFRLAVRDMLVDTAASAISSGDATIVPLPAD